MDYTISNQDTSDNPAYYSHGTMRSMESSRMKEDVNVKDSRKIRLTPTTKNQILTLVHEMAENLMKIQGKTGEEFIQNVNPNQVASLQQGGAKLKPF